MQIKSVNISLPKVIEINGNRVETGIFKEAIDKRLMIRKLNIDGDGQADLVAHGGEFKAVYAYPYEHYATWQSETHRSDFTYGQFGENLTTTGLLETEVFVGSKYRMGDALLQVTQPRVPCYKLAIRMNDPKFTKLFMQAQRTGFYLRVLEEGEIGAGDKIELIEVAPQQLSVWTINNLLYFERDPEIAKRALDIDGLSPGWYGSILDIAEAVR